MNDLFHSQRGAVLTLWDWPSHSSSQGWACLKSHSGRASQPQFGSHSPRDSLVLASCMEFHLFTSEFFLWLQLGAKASLELQSKWMSSCRLESPRKLRTGLTFLAEKIAAQQDNNTLQQHLLTQGLSSRAAGEPRRPQNRLHLFGVKKGSPTTPTRPQEPSHQQRSGALWLSDLRIGL